jgi:glycosyltransferase involved in cell wall biosynthesis
VADSPPGPPAQTVNVALCIDPETFDRFGRMLRHLLVGLVEQAIGVRIISEDPRIADLSLGPVQVVGHQPLIWPMRKSRLSQLMDVLSHQQLNVVHAMSEPTYALAADIAATLDLDLVLGVSSPADAAALSGMSTDAVGRFVAMSEPLWELVVSRTGIPADRALLTRPGMSASEHPACFRTPERSPTMVCTSELERHCGLERLVDALDLVRRVAPPPTTFLIGQGPFENALRRLVRQRGLASSVVFAHPLGRPDGALENADLFVRPTVDEGVRGDVLQAMGAGSLVISRPAPKLDYLIEGQTAVLCPDRAPECLADAIVKALRDPDRAKGLAAGGQEHIRRHHSVSDFAQATATAYRELVLSRSTFAIHR